MLFKRRWVALLIIILIFGFIMQEYEGMQYLRTASRAVKHIVNYTYIFLVGITGYWGLSNHKNKWVKQLWVLLYSAAIVLITAGGILDVNFLIKSERLRDFFHELRFFMISPVPYALLLCLSGITIASKKE